MRQGCFEVSLVDANGVVFDERTLGVDRRCFVRAEPGKEYHVRINVYRNPDTGRFPVRYLRLGLYVDGCDVQYWKRLDLSNEAVLPGNKLLPVSSCFWGFKKNVTELRSFIFATPIGEGGSKIQLSERSRATVAAELGTIRVVAFEAVLVGGTYSNTHGEHEVPGTAQLPGEGEGSCSKFWQQPSVSTAAGRRVEDSRERFRPLLRWQNSTAEPLQELVLHYHSAHMLEFLTSFPALVESLPHAKGSFNAFPSESGSGAGISSSGGIRSSSSSSRSQSLAPSSLLGPAVVIDLTADSDENDTQSEETEVPSSSSSELPHRASPGRLAQCSFYPYMSALDSIIMVSFFYI